MTETLLVQNLAYILAVYLEGRMVSVSFVSFEKYELQMRKNFSTFFFIHFLAQKTKSEKNFDANF